MKRSSPYQRKILDSIVKEMSDINPHTLKEIEHFFLTYKQLQKKSVEINGTDGRIEAEAAFEEGVKLYKEKHA